MRIGKCPECKGEMFIIGMTWNGWREFKCKKCDYALDNKDLDSISFKECLKQMKGGKI